MSNTSPINSSKATSSSGPLTCLSICAVIILVDRSISYRYVRGNSIATLTIRQHGALFKTRIADIPVEFKLNEFVDDSAVGLEGFWVLSPYKTLFTLSVSTDTVTKHRITVNLVCGRSQAVRLWSFSDRSVLSPTNLSSS